MKLPASKPDGNDSFFGMVIGSLRPDGLKSLKNIHDI
jgi:hypothetical protein